MSEQKFFHVHLEGTFMVLLNREGSYIAHVRFDPTPNSDLHISKPKPSPREAIMDALG